MASIIAAKNANVQYAIVGAAQNLVAKTGKVYPVGYLGTGALSDFNTFFTYMQSQGYAATRAATSFKKLGNETARLDLMVNQISKTGYVALTGTGMPLGEGSGQAFDDSFTALAAAYVAATNP